MCSLFCVWPWLLGCHLDESVGVDEPEVATDVGVAHAAEEGHVLSHLLVVFIAFASELEVDDDGLMAVGHYAVGTAFDDGVGVGANVENGTLVEKRPAGREEIGDTRVGKALADEVLDARAGEGAVVEDAVELKASEGGFDVGSGADGGEERVEDVAELDVGGLLGLVVVGDGVGEGAALVALAEVDLKREGGDSDLEWEAGGKEGVFCLGDG